MLDKIFDIQDDRFGIDAVKYLQLNNLHLTAEGQMVFLKTS